MKYILLIVFILVSLTLYFVMQPDPVYQVGKQTTDMSEADDLSAETETAASSIEESEAEQRRAEMKALYKKLEKARRDLDRRLARLKALLWDIELPAEESNRITDQMKNAYVLLKNKRLLGAFRGVEDLQDELSRVEYAYDGLEPIEKMARAKEEEGDRPGSQD